MATSVMAFQVLLWILAIVLALSLLALARQVGVLHARIAPAGALAMNRRLRAGDAAPTMTSSNLDGDAVAIGMPAAIKRMSRSQLLVFVSPTCPVCKELLPAIRWLRNSERRWLEIVLASDGGDPDSHRAFGRLGALVDFPYVLSQSLGVLCSVSKLPYAVLIDKQGIVSALGLVTSREHLESLLEAKRLGKSSIQEYLRSGKEKEGSHHGP